MARKLRSATALGGANLNESAWYDGGENLNFAAFTSTSTPTILGIRVVPLDTASVNSGGDFLAAGLPINRLQGAQLGIVSLTYMAAQTTQDAGVGVMRVFGTLATQITNGGGALTSLNVTALNTALPSGQILNLTNAAGTLQTWTLSAAAAKGATTLAVNSQTPTGTNAVGNSFVGLVGNMIAFGWLHAVGSPVFLPYLPYSLPAVAANTALNTTGDPYGSYLPEYPGDVEVFYVTSAGSISWSAGVINTLAS
jgi:hypothetical protein